MSAKVTEILRQEVSGWTIVVIEDIAEDEGSKKPVRIARLALARMRKSVFIWVAF